MRLKVVRDETDAVVAKMLDGKPVSCGSGCSMCCRQLIYCTLTEALDIVASNLDQVAAMRGTLMEQSIRLLSDSDNRAFFGTSCPLLKDDRCTVYAQRPVVCRTHYVASDASACSDPDGKVHKYDMRKVEQWAIGQIMQSGSQPHSLLPIPMALLLALDCLSYNGR